MSESFNTVADDFFVNLSLQTAVSLPDGRETILGFCQAVQRQFPAMTTLYQRQDRHYVLEGDREAGAYAWLELQTDTLAAGWFNPDSTERAYAFDRWLLDRCVYFLGVTGIDVEYLDLTFGFNLDFVGNRDAIVSEALMGTSAVAALVNDGLGPCIECQPNMVVALDEDCASQARIAVETRSDSYQVRTGQYSDEPISVYFTVRRHPRPGEVLELVVAYDALAAVVEETASRVVVPQVVRPIVAAIATA